MIRRVIEPELLAAAAEMPAVAVTGPRQSGKTTLCTSCFPDHDYVSLEPLDNRAFASRDPRGFLDQYAGPAILDEVHRAPDLFSYLQQELDRDPSPGRYILTGSEHFGLVQGISQSLAGRVTILHLLPLSLDEVRRFPSPPLDLWGQVWTGGYPRIYDRGLRADRWLESYEATYVQRDVRQVLNVTDLEAFATFLRLVAGRTAQELHLSKLGGDVGVSHNTIRAWVSVLEASFVVFRAPAWFRNVRKRTVKAPKLHLIDSGLACHLLRIRSPDQLRTHPLRGPLFESWVAAEILKARLHRARSAGVFHLRETRGLEIDLIVEADDGTIGVEVKSAATVAADFVTALEAFAQRSTSGSGTGEHTVRLVFGGDTGQTRQVVDVVPWDQIQDRSWI